MTALLTGRHIMVDGETLSLGKSGLFFQLGACEFYPEEGRIGATFNRYIDLRSSMAAGRMVDPGTILYWMDGPEEARKRHVAGLQEAPSLVQVLHELAEFCHLTNDRRGLGRRLQLSNGIWSHGAAFDCAMLEDTYASLGLETPFSYRDIRDTRTLFTLAGFDFSGWLSLDQHLLGWPSTAAPHVAHDGESDAIAQALGVMEALQYLRRTER